MCKTKCQSGKWSCYSFVGSSCEGVDSNQWWPLQCKFCMYIDNVYYDKSEIFFWCSCKNDLCAHTNCLIEHLDTLWFFRNSLNLSQHSQDIIMLVAMPFLCVGKWEAWRLWSGECKLESIDEMELFARLSMLLNDQSFLVATTFVISKTTILLLVVHSCCFTAIQISLKHIFLVIYFYYVHTCAWIFKLSKRPPSYFNFVHFINHMMWFNVTKCLTNVNYSRLWNFSSYKNVRIVCWHGD